jgi:hypothetical protein
VVLEHGAVRAELARDEVTSDELQDLMAGGREIERLLEPKERSD